MKYLFAISLLFLLSSLSVNVIAQKNYFQIRSVKYTKDGRNLHFPILIKGTKKDLPTEKINTYLQLYELELLNGFQSKYLFEKVAKGNYGLYGNRFDMIYSVYTNNEKILSLGFDESASGMTTHYWSNYYTYNAGNGDLIQLSDLFTKSGYVQFQKYAFKKGVQHFKTQLEYDMTTDTSTWRVEAENEVINNLRTDIVKYFYVQHNSIVLDSEDILNKNQQGAYDMRVKLTLPEFGNWLNDYGKCVFGITGGNIAQYRSRSLPQLFTGTIGKLPIVLILSPDFKNDYSGIYCYQKSGKGIYLTGNVIHRHLKLNEKDAGYNNKAHITATLYTDSIKGTWIKNGTKMELPISLYRN